MNTAESQPANKKKKVKKQPWQIVIKDRFLTNEKPDNPYIVALLYFFVFFMSFLLVFVCFFQLCEVHKESMMDTLNNGDHVLLLKEVSSYKRGDIVVITKDVKVNNVTTKTNIIKRVIGIPGDTLRFVLDKEKNDGTVILYIKKANESEFNLYYEPYIKEPMKKGTAGFPSDFAFDKDIVVVEEHVFVMGDNRAVSEDSRGKDGLYPISSIYGKSIMTVKNGSALEFLLKFLYRDNNSLY
ncbi:MAG: signal peptidase I [Clostridiales bacterium]|nr:signal peptidase I [Clostridiales bacterium]